LIERIVVGVDGSANGRAALEWAVGLASSLSAEVIVVHGVGLREAAGIHDHERFRKRFDDEWCAALAGSSVRSRRLLLDGDPVSVLLRTVEHEQADLVVVGSRGVGDRPELLLGSTSTQMTQRCTVPVVVVPWGSVADG
jgi:nucleotide-binding universal stress UspA family protein